MTEGTSAGMNHDSYSDDYIADILRAARTFAFVGASANTSRPSYFAMKYLIGKGYKRYKTIERGTDLVGDYGNNGKRITVTTSPANGALQLSEGALGTVYFVWKD